MEDSRAAYVQTRVGSGIDPRYRPIHEYGVIGDCRTAALVGPDGSVDWCCLPHFDSPAVFLRLLDADKGGYFCVRPAGEAQTVMTYLPGTNILETTFTTGEGRLRLVDFMPIRPRKQQASLFQRVRATLNAVPQTVRSGME